VATGQKQFSGGADEKKEGDLDEEEPVEEGHIPQIGATEFILQNDNMDEEESEWDVDFTYVVRGFLSYKIPYILGYRNAEDIELACKVVRNFLNYVGFLP
jgi:hypothetical protein